MKYKIILTDTAFNDLGLIKSFIAVNNPEEAKKYISNIFDKIEKLETSPLLGNKIHNSLFTYTNSLYLICVNHIAIYQINEVAKCIYILRVLSHFQNWKNIVYKELITLEKPLISNEELSIVHLNESMYFDIHRNSLDEETRKYVPDEVFETLEEASDVVNQLIDCYNSEDGPFVYAVIRKTDHANIGYVQLIKMEESWEVGYHIAKMYTGNGYATRSLGLFLNYIKGNTNIDKVYGISLKSNKASIKVLQKNNFELEYEGKGQYQGKTRNIVRMVWNSK